MDAGTGGGLPGIPLAILFPEVHFTLLDATAKKILVAKEIANAIGLKNISGVHSRVEDHNGSYDLIISRAVSTLTKMEDWSKHLVPDLHWIIFKGGNAAEIRNELPAKYKVITTPVINYIEDEYFKDKYFVDVQKA